ncbi:MAG: hypothetical protein C1O27_000224 [Chloroflexi bacterium]|jgi:hypothetical protein|nr:MAG: hypothetical protein C1O27_000224 [Chloroflexota bacterium]
MTNVWAALMPPPVFEYVEKMIRESVSSADWAELSKQVPQLA